MYRTVIGAGGGYFLGLFCAAIASNGEGLFRLRQSSTFAEIHGLEPELRVPLLMCMLVGSGMGWAGRGEFEKMSLVKFVHVASSLAQRLKRKARRCVYDANGLIGMVRAPSFSLTPALK